MRIPRSLQTKCGAAIALLCVCVILGGLLAGCGRGKQTAAPQPTQTATATSTAPATPTPDMQATVIPDLAEKLKTLNDFKAKYGDPPDAKAGRIRIPRIGVDAALDEKPAPANLDLTNVNPFGPTDVVWYNTRANAAFGGEPGAGKNAIFSGHVDYNYPVHYASEAHYQGPGVFAGIDRLQPNDGIEITFKDKTTRYGVIWTKQVPENGDWGAIYAANVAEGDSITLISCTGDFNPATLEYSSRTVVRAKHF